MSERPRQTFANGFVTGAAWVGFVWFFAANWHETTIMVTSAWFYRILAITIAWNVLAAWGRGRRENRRTTEIERYIQPPLREPHD